MRLCCLVVIASLLQLPLVAQDTMRGAAVERLERLAKKGNARAQSQLGSVFYSGKHGVQKDYTNAVFWFQKAAEQGYLNAVFNLALCYEHGRGVAKSTSKALDLYRQAGEEGLLQAQINAAVILLEQDAFADANYFLRQGAAKGNFYCQREYARNLLHGRGATKDFDRAVALLGAAAEGGDSDAKLLLADCYSGMYPAIPRDTQQMVDYLWSAASDGVPEAQSKIGFCYEKGIGVQKDWETAFKWYAQAAESGYPHAMINVGHCFQNGLGVEKDGNKAFEWYKTAAEMDFPVGLYNLGTFYTTGGPVAQNDRIAFTYFDSAAKLGYDKAQYSLGIAYEEGKGVQRNKAMAYYWYKQAADQEFAPAVTSLGYCYFRGFGIKQDAKRARELFERALKLGDEDAGFAMSNLSFGTGEVRTDFPVQRRKLAERPALEHIRPTTPPVATKDVPKKPQESIDAGGGFLRRVQPHD